MRNLKELNITYLGKKVLRPSPPASVVGEFEKSLAIQLPRQYLELLQYSNGGHPELDTFVRQSRGENSVWTIDYFYHLDDDRESDYSMWSNAVAWKCCVDKKCVPFACDGCGNQYVINFGTRPPSVCVCIHDENCRMVALANSFADFIDGLSVNPD